MHTQLAEQIVSEAHAAVDGDAAQDARTRRLFGLIEQLLEAPGPGGVDEVKALVAALGALMKDEPAFTVYPLGDRLLTRLDDVVRRLPNG